MSENGRSDRQSPSPGGPDRAGADDRPGADARAGTGAGGGWAAAPEAPEIPEGSAAGPDAAAPEAEPAYRLSPLTLVTAPLNYLRNYLVPVLVALIAGTYSFNPWMLGGAAAAVATMLLSGLFTWYTVRYQVGAERLEIRRGLIGRSHRSIPLERIRGVDISAHLLHRALGLAVVKIEAAAGGEGSEEGKLDAVTAPEAERLRRVLLRRRAYLRGDSGVQRAEGADDAPARVAAEGEEPDTEVYFTVPASWYLYSVLSLGYLLTPFVALATLVGVLGQGLGGGAAERAGDLAVGIYERASEMAVSLLVAGAVLAALLLLLAMPLFAVVSYTVTHWRFTLRRRGDALIAERGMLTRQSVTLERRRIRGHELADNPLERTRSAVRLRAIVTGLGQAATRAMLMPIGPRSRVEEVVERALSPFRGRLARHPRAALGRRLFRAVTPFAVAAAASALLAPPWVAGVFALLALLGVPLGIDRYRSLGHGDDGRQVSVRSGSLRRVQAVVVRDAIIGWTWKQTLFQRRVGLADLELSVGAGSGGYSAIDVGFAESAGFAHVVTPEMVRPFLEGAGPVAPAVGDGAGPDAGEADGGGERSAEEQS
ncbi:PH domain-containing protein [Streptomonospora wellingtoniae]|uniref:PH domain-containing protein n=1 Tax=Streptomonospora wellingtoniae TaxID=3075544 RepID=A0ABU2KVB2_9ACTN|nr:PH domain-containing protein [Streptomonospora sp. DSM 45055]MDT0302993.1 PH domain-containing protein [Streptomonospora sp. DSM 45055]